MTLYEKKRGKLSDLPEHASGIVVAVSHADQKVKNRLNAMGIFKGRSLTRKNGSSPMVVEIDGAEVAIGREFTEHIIVETEQKIIFLLGNPNVGKSTLFSRITGIKTDASNYPGTTVSLLSGEAYFNKKPYAIYDMPGIYSLEEECKTSQEACELLKTAPNDIAVYVADAQNLERNLFFAMDVIALGKPTILLLNKFDSAAKKGIKIDSQKLERMLGVPVIECEGITGKGLKELSSAIDKIMAGKLKFNQRGVHLHAHFAEHWQTREREHIHAHKHMRGLKHYAPRVPHTAEDKWKLIGQISAQAQKITHRHPSFMEKMETAASTPLLGIPMALAIMIVSFMFILNAGEFLINLLTPLYENYYLPFMQNIFSFAQNTFLWTVLFGSAAGASEGFGILSEAVKIAFIDVLSYVIIFYAVLEFLGDLGYLPRFAILMDKILHRVGLHGYSAIPIMLGLGCKVPAIMAARSLETRRQRVIVFALILMMAPCISQTAMMFSILSPHGIKYLLLTFAIMASVGIIIGAVLNKFLAGDTSDIFMEVPSWQLPRPKILAKKITARAKEYIVEAVPLIILGIFIITLADAAGLVNIITKILRFPIEILMGLPADTAPVVILGFLRKDVSIALLEPYGLSAKQLVTACVFMAMYMPCAGSFFVLLKESGWKDTLMILLITISVSLITGMLINLIL
jgi:ferrous iron transport protein B